MQAMIRILDASQENDRYTLLTHIQARKEALIAGKTEDAFQNDPNAESYKLFRVFVADVFT